ncbi:uncharacterized protein LY79DRAFT_587809 [Colletotrichum navitas]|uniref:Uncharacterized protein n=1 Tax=Colletotrichum navitas TaxID=681940 RepID=A0AAD8Q7A1_9PEZI|nr:uncharacterized protein LY79DRAFT_587809 [Colletotrichum navitas]KAK1596518.1 hypothetical protein LY79DRAFT_587809 [Colletotrichum navitas]
MSNPELGRSGPPDPADGAFPGGVPNKKLDLPLTIVFMILFMLGGYVHLSIYRANAKRGHKFLLSDIMAEFCMLRTVTCIFRITWSIVTTRGVVLLALVTVNGGDALLFAVNIFFAQRLVRSIHPKVGWCMAFGQFTFVLLISVPAIILFNIASSITSFFSVGNADRLELTEDLLKFGSSWSLWLAIFPVLVVSGCLCVPGPAPEKFGTGSLRVKVALLYAGAFLLITGQSVRWYALFNKEPPGTKSIIYSKAVFYTTGFMFDILVIALYAMLRVDERFYIPDGSSGPGDYSGDKHKGQYSVEEIERLVGGLEVPHQIMRERQGPEDMNMVFAIFFATKNNNGDGKTKSKPSDETVAGSDLGNPELPERPKRITRRETLMDAIKMPPRHSMASAAYPDIPGTYKKTGGGGYPPQRPRRSSMSSQFETERSYDVRYQQDWDGSPPYGNQEGDEKV